MNKTIKVGIIGGAGYTGGELIRLCLTHPNVELTYVYSSSQSSKPIYALHGDLLGETDLIFSDKIDFTVDAIFICRGHGQSAIFMEQHSIPDQVVVIDLSHDFRLQRAGNSFVYGLPELNKAAIKTANRIANCGCFATAIQLALLPLAHAQSLNVDVHIQAITGSTGAGQQPTATTQFSWRNNNLSVYKPFIHQHLGEIRQSLQQLQSNLDIDLNFVPIRGDFARGIFASLYTNTDLTQEELTQLYQAYYSDHPFVVISPDNPNLKNVINTNKAMLFVQKIKGKVLIVSMIDNLLKGASGQAIQNLNLRFALPEKAGLGLKAVVY